MITKTSQYRGPHKTLQIISIIELDWSSQHLTNLMHGFLHQHHLQTCYLDWAGKMVQSAAKLVYCESEETMQGSLMVSPLSAKCQWNAHVTMGGSRKYPYPYHGRHLGIPKWRGGLRRLEFRRGGGVTSIGIPRTWGGSLDWNSEGIRGFSGE